MNRSVTWGRDEWKTGIRTKLASHSLFLSFPPSSPKEDLAFTITFTSHDSVPGEIILEKQDLKPALNEGERGGG